MESLNPATGEVIATFEEHTDRQVEDILATVAGAFPHWRQHSFAQRGEVMRQAGAYLRQYKERFGRLITLEMGKPIVQAEAEIEKCAFCCEYYADHAEELLADRRIQANATESYVAFDPIGSVLAVMPWNFP